MGCSIEPNSNRRPARSHEPRFNGRFWHIPEVTLAARKAGYGFNADPGKPPQGAFMSSHPSAMDALRTVYINPQSLCGLTPINLGSLSVGDAWQVALLGHRRCVPTVFMCCCDLLLP